MRARRQEPGDRPPAEACEAGDVTACFFATSRASARREPFDTRHAWKACEAGIPDGCGIFAQASTDPDAAVRALEIACRLRSPLHCGVLASMYDDAVVCCEDPLEPADEREHCIPCPGFDRGRAEGYAAQVLELTGKPYDPRYEDPPSEDEGSEGE